MDKIVFYWSSRLASAMLLKQGYITGFISELLKHFLSNFWIEYLLEAVPRDILLKMCFRQNSHNFVKKKTPAQEWLC